MAGHMGSTRVTTQNLEVVSTDSDRGLILVKGAVPWIQGIMDHCSATPSKLRPFLMNAPASGRPA